MPLVRLCSADINNNNDTHTQSETERDPKMRKSFVFPRTTSAAVSSSQQQSAKAKKLSIHRGGEDKSWQPELIASIRNSSAKPWDMHDTNGCVLFKTGCQRLVCSSTTSFKDYGPLCNHFPMKAGQDL